MGTRSVRLIRVSGRVRRPTGLVDEHAAAPHTLRPPAPLSSRGTVNSTREHCAGLLVMTCIAMQPLITSCCYEGMRMLHGTACAAAATQRRDSWYPRRPRLPALQGGRRGPARSRATGNCRRLAAEARFKAFLWLLYFIFSPVCRWPDYYWLQLPACI